jgi:hypothetical protein
MKTKEREVRGLGDKERPWRHDSKAALQRPGPDGPRAQKEQEIEGKIAC